MITDVFASSVAWPRLFRRVVAALRHRGVDLASAEDAAQEAVTRALAGGVSARTEDEALRWLHTVAWRAAVDARRRRLPMVDGDLERIEHAAATDVAGEVEARLRLRAVEGALPVLTAQDRIALFSAAPADATRQESVKLAVRRHRARARLLALVEGIAAIVIVPWRRLARLGTPAAAATAALIPAFFFLLAQPPPPADPQVGLSRPTDAITRAGLEPRAMHRADAKALDHRALPEPAVGAGPRGRRGVDDDGRRSLIEPVTLAAPIPDPTGASDGDGDRGRVGARPKDPRKPTACAGSPKLGEVCTPDGGDGGPTFSVPALPALPVQAPSVGSL